MPGAPPTYSRSVSEKMLKEVPQKVNEWVLPTRLGFSPKIHDNFQEHFASFMGKISYKHLSLP